MEWLKKIQEYLLGVVIAVLMVVVGHLGFAAFHVHNTIYVCIIAMSTALVTIGIGYFIKKNSLVIGAMLGGVLTFFYAFGLSYASSNRSSSGYLLGVFLFSFIVLIAIILIRKKMYGDGKNIQQLLLGIAVAIVFLGTTSHGVNFFKATYKPHEITVPATENSVENVVPNSPDRTRNDKIVFLIYSFVAFVAIVNGIIFLKISSLSIGLLFGGIIQLLIGLSSYQFDSPYLKFLIFLALFLIIIGVAFLVERRTISV